MDVVVPRGDNLDTVHREYVALAAAGRATAEQRALFCAVWPGVCRHHGAAAVVFGSTGLFLAFAGHGGGFPVIDGAQAQIDALYRAPIKRA